jgi:hypothetical protein
VNYILFFQENIQDEFDGLILKVVVSKDNSKFYQFDCFVYGRRLEPFFESTFKDFLCIFIFHVGRHGFMTEAEACYTYKKLLDKAERFEKIFTQLENQPRI